MLDVCKGGETSIRTFTSRTGSRSRRPMRRNENARGAIHPEETNFRGKDGNQKMALFKYPGKKTWWYEFHFAGQKARESAKTRSKEMARSAENARRRDLEESYHGLKKRNAPRLFSVASEEWLTLKKHSIAERSYAIEQANLK